MQRRVFSQMAYRCLIINLRLEAGSAAVQSLPPGRFALAGTWREILILAGRTCIHAHASPDTSCSMVGLGGAVRGLALLQLGLFSGPAVAYRLPKRHTAPLEAWKANGAAVIPNHHEQRKGPQSGGHEVRQLAG